MLKWTFSHYLYLPGVEQRRLVQRNSERSDNNQLKQQAQKQRNDPGEHHSDHNSLDDLLPTHKHNLSWDPLSFRWITGNAPRYHECPLVHFEHDDGAALRHPGQQHRRRSDGQPADVQTAGCCVQLMDHRAAHPQRHQPAAHKHWRQDGANRLFLRDWEQGRCGWLEAYPAVWDRWDSLVTESHTWRQQGERSGKKTRQICD